MHIPCAQSAAGAGPLPVCVLLGGAGQHRTPVVRMAKVAVLLLSPTPLAASAPARVSPGSAEA